MRLEAEDKYSTAGAGALDENTAASVKSGQKDAVSDSVKDEIVVLKFGSSVLRNTDDLATAVTEIYRHTRHGRKVVAVVSAFEGETDALYAQAASLGAGEGSRHAPRLIALGEERSAALLAIACEGTGLDARIAGARQIALHAGGPVDDAHPENADVEALRHEIDRHDVVIVPGFVALGETGEPVLLGRGGTDLTAVFLAYVLGLDGVTLVKDVDGVYDRDPAEAGAAARRYDRLSWEEARSVAGKLIQPKSIDFAAARETAIHVARANAGFGTTVAFHTDEAKAPAVSKKLRVAVAGLGVIGEGAGLRTVADENDYELCGALVRDASKPRAGVLISMPVHTDVDKLLSEKPDVIIDALPSGEAGAALIHAALSQGVSIVSANKQAVAGSLAKLHALADANGARLAYAAAVGGGAPMVETAQRAAKAGNIVEMTAILNGTVNFILDLMKGGVSFDDAVRRAQDAGFAEPDPTADLSGEDARAKIAILAYHAFGVDIDLDAIELEALDVDRAAGFLEEGGVWKQLARISKNGDVLTARVSFECVDDDPFFSATPGESNALQAITAEGEVFVCKGKGAGRRPTVESLFADLGDIARARQTV